MKALRGWQAVALIGAAGCCLPPQAFAEPEAVGLDAHGVDPWIALHRVDLDVRDAYNRPVSRAIIERQIRTATRAKTESLSFFSKLPHARTMLRALEGLLTLFSNLRASPPWQGVFASAQPWSGRPFPKLAIAWLLLLVFLSPRDTRRAALRYAARPSSGRVSVLRC